jgi:hypothetical protein
MDKSKSLGGIESALKSRTDRSTSLCGRAAPATGSWARAAGSMTTASTIH